MARDLSKLIYCFIKDFYSHRDDITINIKKNKVWDSHYTIHLLIHIKPTDGLYATINKGIDKTLLMNQMKGYLNLDQHDCVITYQNVYPETINQIDI